MTKRLFAILRYTTVVTLVAAVFVLGGCGEDDKKPTKNIYELISEQSTCAMIKAQIDLNADLKAKLQDANGTYTFFAPNDLAMGAILSTLGLSDFSSISQATLSTVLNYHLANSVKTSGDMTNGAKITTAQGEDITVEVTSTGQIKLKTGATTAGTVITQDIEATNGRLHIVGDYPLVPPTIGALIVATLGKVAQPILLSSTFSILAQGILKADAGKAANLTIVGAMVAQSAQTFFAPPDAVLTAAGWTAAGKTAAEWDAMIRGHMVPGVTLSTLAAGTPTSMAGKTITTTATTVKGSAAAAPTVNVVVSSKITTSNGVIYPIQGLIVN